jgi:hypothetical protein
MATYPPEHLCLTLSAHWIRGHGVWLDNGQSYQPAKLRVARKISPLAVPFAEQPLNHVSLGKCLARFEVPHANHRCSLVTVLIQLRTRSC